MTTIETPIERALKTARKIPLDELEQMRARAESAETEIDNTLPLERQQNANLRKIANESAAKVKVLSAMMAANENYAELSTEAFGYRGDNKLPLLMPFSLSDPGVWISNFDFSSSFPKAVTEFYKDVQDHLEQLVQNYNAPIRKSRVKWMSIMVFAMVISWSIFVLFSGWEPEAKTVSYSFGNVLMFFIGLGIGALIVFISKGEEGSSYSTSAQFDGLIPEPIRQRIRKARSLGVFSEVFILSEVPDLKVEKTPRLARVGDPLVIGYDGRSFWLIAAFDTTPVEAMAMTAPVVKA